MKTVTTQTAAPKAGSKFVLELDGMDPETATKAVAEALAIVEKWLQTRVTQKLTLNLSRAKGHGTASFTD